MAQYINDPVPKHDPNDLPKTTKKLHDYVSGLVDQLQWVLANLDGDNIERYDEIFNRLEDSEGNISTLEQTSTSITARVENNEGDIANLTLTASGLQTSVGNLDQGMSTLTQTVSGISTQVSDNEGNISTLQQTVNGLSTQVADNEGNISSLTQTTNGLSSTVQSQSNQISSLNQTATSLTSTVSDLNGKYTSLKQTVDGFDFTGYVTFTALDDELASYPTESDLSRGRTSIDGGCIDTGTVSLDYLDISNGYGSLTIESGSNGVYGTRGPQLTGPDSDIYLIVTNAACRLTAYDTNFYVGDGVVHSDEVIGEGSDARIKNTILYDVAERYEAVYKDLKPARFKMNWGKSDRFHTGFIAQDIEKTLSANDLTNKDLAALIYDPDNDRYSIRYGELIALNTAMVQKLMARVEELEAKLKPYNEEV